MKGLTQGEQSTLVNPTLQLICRSGGFLADLVAGTFIVEDIKSAGAAATTKVASTPFATLTHKIGTGRYAILTGDTSAWSLGTHRVRCAYQMAAAGPTYYQNIEFEILESGDWPTGNSYVGYLSTRRALDSGYVPSTVTRQELHNHICEVSRRIEQWTGRWFDPRYLTFKKKGRGMPALLLQHPIIAIEDIYAIWQTTSGQDSYKYEQYLYRVYNRHLEGFYETDDRKHPKIDLTDVDGTIVKVKNFAWPYGNQNIQVQGVFGYTDPEFDATSGEVLIGTTPLDIGRVVGSMIARIIEDPTLTSLMSWSPGSIKSMRTRDQSVTFGGGGSAASGGTIMNASFTGDPLLDNILAKYCRPFAVSAL